MDTERERLKQAEQHAHALYQRLSDSAVADPLFVETAERLWQEAAEALRLHERNTIIRGPPRR